MRPREQPRITESYRRCNPGDDLLSERPQLGLRLLQPVRHPHLAIHRRRRRKVLVRLLALSSSAIQLREAGVAVSHEGTHTALFGKGLRIAVVIFGRFQIR